MQSKTHLSPTTGKHMRYIIEPAEMGGYALHRTLEDANGEKQLILKGVGNNMDEVAKLLPGTSPLRQSSLSSVDAVETVAREVVRFQQGHQGKIGVIKAIRTITGCDLKQAKEAAERFME